METETESTSLELYNNDNCDSHPSPDLKVMMTGIQYPSPELDSNNNRDSPQSPEFDSNDDWDSPTSAPNTKRMQESIQASIAVSPSALGVLVVTVLKMLTRTRNSVTSSAMRPGMMSGGTTKLGPDLLHIWGKLEDH